MSTWEAIYENHDLSHWDFTNPYFITSTQIKEVSKQFTKTSETEVRLLCKQDTREDRPKCFTENNLFLLPIKNGTYAIVNGEGYLDIESPPVIEPLDFSNKLDFELETAKIGDSEMQHIDFAFASGILQDFTQDNTLNLTIRGRKYCPKFEFRVGNCNLTAQSVQTEVDAGYEGRNQIVLLEGKNSTTKNTIIRQLYYPFRQWQSYTTKPVRSIFFEKRKGSYNLWEYEFLDVFDYNSITLKQFKQYNLKTHKKG